jgi:hypothetical protein
MPSGFVITELPDEKLMTVGAVPDANRAEALY